MTSGIQLHKLAFTAMNQLDCPIDTFPERRRIRQRPEAMPKRESTGPPQLSPHGHPMPRRLHRKPHRQHHPPPLSIITTRHISDCSSRYPEGLTTHVLSTRPPSAWLSSSTI
jgi:hypothetical protein